MKYDDIRSTIKSGDVLAWTHKEWGSWNDFQIQFVRMFTRSEYSHVGVAWVVGDRVFVIEAVVPKVRVFSLSDATPFYLLPCGVTYWNDEIAKKALSFVGQKYSKWQAILGALNKLRCGKDESWQCAELVNTLLQSGGVLKYGESLSTPTAIVEVLQRIGYPTYMVI